MMAALLRWVIVLTPATIDMELVRFPPREVADQQRWFACNCRLRFEGLYAIRRSDRWLLDAALYCQHAECCWDALHSLHRYRTDYWPPGQAPRWPVDRLRRLLGDEAFHAGQMPLPVPFWALAWLD